MSSTTVDVSDVAPHVKQITLNRPERLNALNFELTADLHDALDAVGADAECRVAILTGAGRGFCSGLDLKDFGTPPAPGEHPHVHAGIGGQEFMANLTVHLRSTPQIIVAAVNGAAYGGGLGIAAAADLRIAGASATFCSAFIRTGLTGTDIGVSYTLPRLLGRVTRLRPHRHRSHHRRGRGRAPRPRHPGGTRRRAARRGGRARVGDRFVHRGRSAHDQGGHVGQPRCTQPQRSARAREPQPDDRRTRTGGPGLHGRVHGSPPILRTRWPVIRSTTSPSSASTTPSRRACSKGTTPGAITFDAGMGALADAGARIRDIDGVVGAHGSRASSTRRASARCGARCRAWASPRCSRPRAPSPTGSRTTVLISRGFGRRLHRPRVDRAVDPSRQRVRRAVRHVHRGRVRAHRPAPHAPLRHHARGLATVAATIRNNGHVNPEAVLLRPGAVHACRTSSTAAWSPTRSTSSTAR